MGNTIQYVIVGVVVGAAVAWLIVRAVRTLKNAARGRKCEGCPLAESCHKGAGECHGSAAGCGCGG